jgi:hypothetical protein
MNRWGNQTTRARLKSYISPSDRNFLAWLVFLAGITFSPLAWILWFWLDGNIKGDASGHPALWPVMYLLFGMGILFCTIAPLFSAGSPWRQLFLCIYGFFAGVLAAYLAGPLILLFIAII